MQSRGPRLNDVLSGHEVNEIADTPRGQTSSSQPSEPSEGEKKKEAEETLGNFPDISRSFEDLSQEVRGVSQNEAKVRTDGKVEIEEKGQTKN